MGPGQSSTIGKRKKSKAVKKNKTEIGGWWIGGGVVGWAWSALSVKYLIVQKRPGAERGFQ